MDSNYSLKVVSGTLFSVIILLFAGISIYLLMQVDELKVTLQDISTIQTYAQNVEAVGGLQDRFSNSQISFYKDITDVIVSRASFVISLIGAIATMFTVITIYFSIQNFNLSSDLRSKIDSIQTLQNKVDNRMVTIQNEVKNLKAMQHWVEGIVYLQDKRIVDAIDEFIKADIGNNGKVKLQLAIVHSDLLSNEIKKNRFLEYHFEKAEHYLLDAININNNEIACAESMLTLACLYGVVGKYYRLIDMQKSKDFFHKSKDYIGIARITNMKNPRYYKNAAITYLYLEDEESMDDALMKAKNCIKLDERYELDDEDVLSAFEEDDKEFIKEKMGEDKWDDLENNYNTPMR